MRKIAGNYGVTRAQRSRAKSEVLSGQTSATAYFDKVYYENRWGSRLLDFLHPRAKDRLVASGSPFFTNGGSYDWSGKDRKNPLVRAEASAFNERVCAMLKQEKMYLLRTLDKDDKAAKAL